MDRLRPGHKATLWTATAGSAGDEPSKTQPPDPETPQMTKLTDELDAVQRSNQMWGKRPDMIVRGRVPFNAEPPAPVLADGEITALDAFYSRNHGPFPDIAPEQWRLNIDGAVDTPLDVTYDQLTSEFTAHSVVATLVCAGNRRAELLNVHPIPGKDPWAHGAFAAPDVAPEAVPVQSYGSSIPLTKALSDEVLLAWQMNSQPLPRAHGGPVRVVVPGYIGARSVKWVTAITVQPVPSQNYF